MFLFSDFGRFDRSELSVSDPSVKEGGQKVRKLVREPPAVGVSLGTSREVTQKVRGGLGGGHRSAPLMSCRPFCSW